MLSFFYSREDFCKTCFFSTSTGLSQYLILVLVLKHYHHAVIIYFYCFLICLSCIKISISTPCKNRWVTEPLKEQTRRIFRRETFLVVWKLYWILFLRIIIPQYFIITITQKIDFYNFICCKDLLVRAAPHPFSIKQF